MTSTNSYKTREVENFLEILSNLQNYCTNQILINYYVISTIMFYWLSHKPLFVAHGEHSTGLGEGWTGENPRRNFFRNFLDKPPRNQLYLGILYTITFYII